MAENIKDPAIRDWLIPSFSTTTALDESVSAVIMMATFKAYFAYVFKLKCGIPKVTLEGEKNDWAVLRRKAEKFSQFGEEPKRWIDYLLPVLDSFVKAFDASSEPTDAILQEQKLFWSLVCHRTPGGSKPTYICGWATVFCLWDEGGNFRGDMSKNHPALAGGGFGTIGSAGLAAWPAINTKNLTKAVAEVSVIVDDNGVIHRTTMLAGIPGFRVSKREGGGMEEEVLSPVVGWAMFEVPSPSRKH